MGQTGKDDKSLKDYFLEFNNRLDTLERMESKLDAMHEMEKKIDRIFIGLSGDKTTGSIGVTDRLIQTEEDVQRVIESIEKHERSYKRDKYILTGISIALVTFIKYYGKQLGLFKA
jgi:hypothetical protein